MIDASVDDIRLEVMKLNKHYKRVVNAPSHEAPLLHTTPPPSLPTSPSLAAGLPSAGIIADRPHGHRVDLIHREGGYGSVTTFIHPPIKGAYDLPPKPRFSDSTGTHTDSVVKLPKIPFPLFEGDNPRLWLSRCELYFDMYSVPTKMWIKVASMYFKGAVGRWWQSIQKRLSSASWSEFSSQFNNCLGREQHELSLNMWSSFLNRLTN